MIINKYWLGRVFKEEAGDDGVADGGEGGHNDAQAVADAIADGNQENEKPDWLLDKYMPEGKSIEEATQEQAKAYTELQSRFGSFTGAPDEYSLESIISEELTQEGFKLDTENPMVKDALEFAKEMNMNQDGFSKMINFWAMNELASSKAYEQDMKEAFAKLENGQGRMDNISAWAAKSLPADMVQSLDGMMNTPESVKVVEKLIAMSRPGAVTPDDAAPAPTATADEVRAMQFEKDEHGGRRIQTDPEFRAKFEKLRNQVYGTAEHRQMVG